jgi:hypothetical protein
MTEEKRREQIWISLKKNQLLPSLQKRIILNLAKNKPQTINETAKAIKGHYKASWLAFKSLTQKGLVQEVGIKEYRKRNYPTHWLTDEGVVVALFEGADPETLLKKTREIYPENQSLLYYLEIAPKLNPKVLEIGYSAVKTKGKLEPIDLATIMLTQMQTETSIQDFWKTVAILKNYPKQYKSFKKQVEQMLENLSQLNESI